MKRDNFISTILIVISIPIILGIVYYGKIYLPKKRFQDQEIEYRKQRISFCENGAKNIFEIDSQIFHSIKNTILTEKFNIKQAKLALNNVPVITNEFYLSCLIADSVIGSDYPIIGSAEKENLISFHYSLKELLEGKIEMEEYILTLPEKKDMYREYLPKFLSEKKTIIEKNINIIKNNNWFE